MKNHQLTKNRKIINVSLSSTPEMEVITSTVNKDPGFEERTNKSLVTNNIITLPTITPADSELKRTPLKIMSKRYYCLKYPNIAPIIRLCFYILWFFDSLSLCLNSFLN
jgi:hypothetical protein